MSLRVGIGACVLAMLAGQARGQASTLSATEAMKVNTLLDLMIQLQSEMSETMTLRECLNPAGQAGVQVDYEKVGSPAKDPTIADALKHYKDLIKNGKVKKNPKQAAGTASTSSAKGIDNDVVELSADDLATWCDMTADPVDRAKAKMSIFESLANELAHVYQCTPRGLSPMDKDKASCDAERDSDILHAKLMRAWHDRLLDADGEPHTTLAEIEAEGKAGKLLAKCLRDLGVDDTTELAAFIEASDWELKSIEDRRDNLFNNEINGGRSWRALYYDGKYQSPLLLEVDRELYRLDRILKMTFEGRMVRFAIPNDGKRPQWPPTITRNADGHIVITIVTIGPNGERCTHTYTDTDDDGLPEESTHVAKVLATNNSSVAPDDSTMGMVAPIDELGPNPTLLLHDRYEGILWGVELDGSDVPTGIVRELVRSPVIADPQYGFPGAADFYRLHAVEPLGFLGQFHMVFTADAQVNATCDVQAANFVYDTSAGVSFFQGFSSLAQSLAPNNALGGQKLPHDDTGVLLLEGNPFELIEVDARGRGGTNPVAAGFTDATGIAPPVFLFGPQLPNIWRITSLATGDAFDAFVASRGQPFDRLQDAPGFEGELLALSTTPSLLVRFGAHPAGFFDCAGEWVLEREVVSGFALPEGTMPLRVLTPEDDIPLLPIPLINGIAQTLYDLDGDGVRDDAVMIFRPCGEQIFMLQGVLDAVFGPPLPLPPLPLSFEPASFARITLPGDGLDDVLVRDLATGEDVCYQNALFGGWFAAGCPQPCPADLSGSADQNDPSYGHPDGLVDSSDFFYFLDQFVAGNTPVADLSGSVDPNSPQYGVPDGQIDAADFFYFLDLFVAGCP